MIGHSKEIFMRKNTFKAWKLLQYFNFFLPKQARATSLPALHNLTSAEGQCYWLEFESTFIYDKNFERDLYLPSLVLSEALVDTGVLVAAHC